MINVQQTPCNCETHGRTDAKIPDVAQALQWFASQCSKNCVRVPELNRMVPGCDSCSG